MHMLKIVRAYLNLTQPELAKMAGITQTQLSFIENRKPYGELDKFHRVSKALGLPLEAIVKNDPRKIPLSFFDEHPEPEYKPVPKTGEAMLGRQGEELIFQQEKDKLEKINPVLAKLAIPFFKKECRAVGYDILSFDEMGKPVCLEVKTSTLNGIGFKVSVNEMETAKRFEKQGISYAFVQIWNWGTPEQTIRYLNYPEMKETHIFESFSYFCRPKPKGKEGLITGLEYFRRLRGLRQAEIAAELGILQHKWSQYENGHHEPSVEMYLKIGVVLDATLDELVSEYDVAMLDAAGVIM